MTVYTTLNKIRAFKPCEDGWEKLLKSLGKTSPDDEPLALVSILESNGLDDAIWCTRTVFDEHRDKIVRFAIGCAENVLHVFEKAMPDDLRPRQAIQAAKDYLEGKITEDAILAAASAAADAAYAAASADAYADWAAASAAADAAYAARDAKHAAYAARDAWAADDAARDAGAKLKDQEDLFRKIFGEVQS